MTFALPSRACRVENCKELVEHPKRFCPAHWSRIDSSTQSEIADAWIEAQRQTGKEARDAWGRWGELVMRAAKDVAKVPW